MKDLGVYVIDRQKTEALRKARRFVGSCRDIFKRSDPRR